MGFVRRVVGRSDAVGLSKFRQQNSELRYGRSAED